MYHIYIFSEKRNKKKNNQPKNLIRGMNLRVE